MLGIGGGHPPPVMGLVVVAILFGVITFVRFLAERD
jgi:hypothetical protein